MEESQELIDEIYKEMLYVICYPVGMQTFAVGQESMFTYLQNAFKVRVQAHMDLLKAVKSRKPPSIRLNVDIIEAKNLAPKDSNGLADPFMTLNLASDDSPAGSYETDVKLETLRPVWNETCTFTVEKEVNKEVLKIQVWDLDPAETTGEKLQKIYDVKGIKGFGRFLKEVVGPSGKEVNELIGSVDIHLNKVPAKGNKAWYTLEKTDKVKQFGEVHIGLSFGSFRNPKATQNEHRILVKQFLLEQLEVSKAGEYQCDGKFCAQAANLLTQHAVQGGLGEACTAFIRWSVFCEVHNNHRLSSIAFNELLAILKPYVKSKNGEHEESRAMFWADLTTLTVTVFEWLKEFQNKGLRGQDELVNLRHMLEFLAHIDKMVVWVDLFPKHLYGYLYDEVKYGVWNIERALIHTIQESARLWLGRILKCQDNIVTTQDQGIIAYIDLVQKVRTEFEQAVRMLDPIFLSTKNFKYAHHLLQVYDNSLYEEIQPFVTAVCGNLVSIDSSMTDESQVDKLVGKSIFTLFVELRKFLTLALKVTDNTEELKLKNCHLWFSTAVQHWLDASIHKAKLRTAKAIELDNLQPLDTVNRHSTSAVDTVSIFFQVFKFWQDLEWPDATTGFIFVRNIIEEICNCCELYTGKMTERAASLKEPDNIDSFQKFKVTTEWCSAINNLDYMRNNLEKMVEDFGVLPESENSESKKNLITIIENALDRQRHQIDKFIDEIAGRMAPNLALFLSEGAGHLHEESTSMDRTMAYLEDSLTVLNAELSSRNFERIMDKVWLEICHIVATKTKITMVEPKPILYANLLKAINLLLENFQCSHNNEENCLCKGELDQVIKKLQLYGYDTDELIHQFYVDRHRAQKNLCDASKYGMLTIQCALKDNLLKIDIMNAKDLVPIKPGRPTDIYAKVRLLPAHKFKNVKVPKTQSIKNSMFPMFDEEIEICLSEEAKTVENALLMIRLKDKRLFGFKHRYMADCFISLDEILENNGGSQIHLPLHRPILHDYASVEALAFRKSDEKARRLLKGLKKEKCILHRRKADE